MLAAGVIDAQRRLVGDEERRDAVGNLARGQPIGRRRRRRTTSTAGTTAESATAASGKGRALGVGEVKFSDQVLPTVKKVVYGIDFKRVMRSKLVLGIADGWLSADGNVIYRASDLKVGLFRDQPAPQAS